MVKFYKYHGAGNDFIMIDNREKTFNTKDKKYIKLLCNRSFGIGADGIILMENSKKADCFMNYYNSDGSLAEMCGNGVRCLAKFYIDITKSKKQELNIDTRAGIKKIICNIDGSFSVNMGKPNFISKDFPKNNKKIENMLFDFVSMGNPHAISFVKNLGKLNIKETGTKVENNKIFPNKINVEFVEKIDNKNYKVKVWERGSGATLACGTGACAVFSILDKYKKIKDEIILHFPGGKLFLSKNHEGNIILRGPAEFVFEGKIIL